MALLFQLTQKVAQGFQAFWDRYPRREAKKDATKAWNQVKPTPEIEEQIHAALDWQIPLWEEREKKFIPLPATYLRGERWTDEPPTPPKPKVTVSPTIGRRLDDTMKQYEVVARIEMLIRQGMDREAAKRKAYIEAGWIRE